MATFGEGVWNLQASCSARCRFLVLYFCVCLCACVHVIVCFWHYWKYFISGYACVLKNIPGWVLDYCEHFVMKSFEWPFSASKFFPVIILENESGRSVKQQSRRRSSMMPMSSACITTRHGYVTGPLFGVIALPLFYYINWCLFRQQGALHTLVKL